MPRSWAIVGAGAVGLYYGGRLADAGEEVHFLVRSDYEALRERGLTVRSVDGDFSLDQPMVHRRAGSIGPVDVVVVAWKATANRHYREVIAPLLHEGTVILTLQNGLGNTEALAELFGAARILGGLCFVCINRLEPGLVSHTGGGMVSLGDFGGEQRETLAAVVTAFRQAGVSTHLAEDLEKAQWVKLVWNVPFNGLCIAEDGIDTEALLALPDGEVRVRELMEEVLAGAAALGFEIPPSVVDEQIKRTRPMGPYRPSSMIDYVEGREVEVEAIWEEPLRRAREAGAVLPKWEGLLDEIRGRIAKR